MPELSQQTMLYVTGGVFALALLLLLLSLRLFRRSRRDVFWRRRREAGQRGWRLFLVSAVFFLFSLLSCVGTVLIGTVSNEDDATATPTVALAEEVASATLDPTLNDGVTDVQPSEPPAEFQAESSTTPTLAPEQPSVTPPDTATPDEPSPTPSATPTQPTNTPAPSVVIIVTATPGATPTHTPFPTFTPNARPLESNVTPAADASLTITALDDEVSDTLQPVDPAETFPAGTERIYLFVTFDNMTQGVLWRRELYRNGERIEGSSYLWGLPTSGETSFFFGSDGGFMPGRYEVRLYIGSGASPASRMTFTITDAD